MDAVEIEFLGARRITSLALGPDGAPHIAMGDTVSVRLASRVGDGWVTQDVAAAGDRPLGQLLSLVVDDAGNPTVGFYEVTEPQPLRGLVIVAARR